MQTVETELEKGSEGFQEGTTKRFWQIMFSVCVLLLLF